MRPAALVEVEQRRGQSAVQVVELLGGKRSAAGQHVRQALLPELRRQHQPLRGRPVGFLVAHADHPQQQFGMRVLLENADGVAQPPPAAGVRQVQQLDADRAVVGPRLQAAVGAGHVVREESAAVPHRAEVAAQLVQVALSGKMARQ